MELGSLYYRIGCIRIALNNILEFCWEICVLFCPFLCSFLSLFANVCMPNSGLSLTHRTLQIEAGLTLTMSHLIVTLLDNARAHINCARNLKKGVHHHHHHHSICKRLLTHLAIVYPLSIPMLVMFQILRIFQILLILRILRIFQMYQHFWSMQGRGIIARGSQRNMLIIIIITTLFASDCLTTWLSYIRSPNCDMFYGT